MSFVRNPHNLQVLTPGTPLLALIDCNLTNLSSNRLSRWLYIQQGSEATKRKGQKSIQ